MFNATQFKKLTDPEFKAPAQVMLSKRFGLATHASSILITGESKFELEKESALN